VAGAGLDVFENEPDIHPELFCINNVSLTPHIGTATIEARTYVICIRM
jgi:glyoxylate reductase